MKKNSNAHFELSNRAKIICNKSPHMTDVTHSGYRVLYRTSSLYWKVHMSIYLISFLVIVVKLYK